MGLLFIGIIIVVVIAMTLSYRKDFGTVDERIAKVQGMASSNMNPWAAKYHTKKATATAAHTKALTAQVQAIHELDLEPLRLLWDKQKHEAEHENYLTVIELATNNKRTFATQDAIDRQEGLDRLEVLKTRELKQIETDAALTEQLNTIRAILEYKHLRFNEFDEVRSRIMTLIEEEDRIENSNASVLVKSQKLELIEDAKSAYGEILNVFKNRLLEAGDGSEGIGIEAFGSFGGRLGVDTKTIAKDSLSLTDSGSGGGEGND